MARKAFNSDLVVITSEEVEGTGSPSVEPGRGDRERVVVAASTINRKVFDQIERMTILSVSIESVIELASKSS
jgi:hypothetical protein